MSGIPATSRPVSSPSSTRTERVAQVCEAIPGVDPAIPSQETGWMAVISAVG